MTVLRLFMVEKNGELVIVQDEPDDLAAFLREIDLPGDESQAINALSLNALHSALSDLVQHELNRGEGKSSVLVGGKARVHFRLRKTLATAFIVTVSVATAVFATAKTGGAAAPALFVAVADAVDRVKNLFNRLAPQEILVVGALAEAMKTKRQRDPKQRSATAGEVEEVFRAREEQPPAVPETLVKLMTEGVLDAEPRDGDIYYKILF